MRCQVHRHQSGVIYHLATLTPCQAVSTDQVLISKTLLPCSYHTTSVCDRAPMRDLLRVEWAVSRRPCFTFWRARGVILRAVSRLRALSREIEIWRIFWRLNNKNSCKRPCSSIYPSVLGNRLC